MMASVSQNSTTDAKKLFRVEFILIHLSSSLTISY